MLKYFLSALLFVNTVSFAGKYNIEVRINSAPRQKLVLAYYFLGNVYGKDTVVLDGNGAGVFTGDSLLPQGLYMIYLDNENHFDFLLGADQVLSLKNEKFSFNKLKVKGAAETEEFEKYLVFFRDLQKQKARLREAMQNTAARGGQEKINKQQDGLTAKLHNYRQNIKEKYPGTFLSCFLLSNYVPTLDISTLPEEVRDNDSLLLMARFNYQKEHYWDNFDYTDKRMLYTPFYKKKLEKWFTKVLCQNYDSVKVPVMDFIEDTRPHKRIFQFVASYFLNSSINSNIMGMDALFVDIAKRYYLPGDAFWANKETMDKVKENVLFFENNLIGNTAPGLTLENVDGGYSCLHEIDAAYTVIIIYEPGCSHCNAFISEFYKEVYLPFRDKGLEVYAIYSMGDKDEWVGFLTEHNLYDWVNVWDENNVSGFKVLYDARKTPVTYLLDKDKEIVAKKLSAGQLRSFLEDKL